MAGVPKTGFLWNRRLYVPIFVGLAAFLACSLAYCLYLPKPEMSSNPQINLIDQALGETLLLRWIRFFAAALADGLLNGVLAALLTWLAVVVILPKRRKA